MSTKVKHTFIKTRDKYKDIKFKVKGDKGEESLCHGCGQIFDDSSSSSSSDPGSLSDKKTDIFCLNLEEILSHKERCTFCGLLFKSICRPEYDLFKPEHISKHLSTSVKLKDLKSFKEWAKTFKTWTKWTGGEDNWPFGYTRDQDEAAKEAQSTAEELFRVAEKKDLMAGTVDSMYGTDNALSNALQATAFATGVATLASNEKAVKALASAHLVASQLAMFGIGKAKALPCLFIVRLYGVDEPKHGVLSVRVYAHGRAPRAPLDEICHFSLRLEQREPRQQGMQLWYGRILEPKIDIPFFAKCLDSCQQFHGNTCESNKFSWPSQSNSQTIDQNFPFRLINVEKMKIIDTRFGKIDEPYVALSYIWGKQGWTDHWDNHQGKMIRSEHTRLGVNNLSTLLKAGSLLRHRGNDVYIPKTIKDAIKICKRMGQRFLWVDSLCIIQDEKHPDKPANLARMGQIYSSALFTIVAGDAESADAGMGGITEDRIVADQVMGEVLGNIQLFLPIGMERFSVRPWESRAWTFQEKLLSKRMLVVASGYAVWRCRGAIWREDVNALDGNTESASFPWLQLQPVPECENLLEESGLKITEEDESIRLYRSPAFYQYIKVVEDYSAREIRDPWETLKAFSGLQTVLESPQILNSSFRWGLPTRFMDAAILWQPQGTVHRRKNNEMRGNVLEYSPPSWSWAGWESSEIGLKGPSIGFDIPFEVYADERGLLMRPNPLGEERMRPKHQSIYGVEKGQLVDIGLLHQRNVLKHVSSAWQLRPSILPRDVRLNYVTDRHLVFHTEVATLYLGNDCFRVRTRTKNDDTEYFHTTLQDINPSPKTTNVPLSPEVPEPEQDVTVSCERWIIDATTSKQVGTAKMHFPSEAGDTGLCEAVTAMVISEAQYMGNEKRVDVLGNPLYNIMIVMKRTDGVAERMGLGKIYKSAWKRARSRLEVVILE